MATSTDGGRTWGDQRPIYIPPTGFFTDPALLDQIEALEAQADRDLQAMNATNVNFRWGHQQVAIVKRAARAMGLPYQVYIKHVVLKQALADLAALEHAGA